MEEPNRSSSKFKLKTPDCNKDMGNQENVLKVEIFCFVLLRTGFEQDLKVELRNRYYLIPVQIP